MIKCYEITISNHEWGTALRKEFIVAGDRRTINGAYAVMIGDGYSSTIKNPAIISISTSGDRIIASNIHVISDNGSANYPIRKLMQPIDYGHVGSVLRVVVEEGVACPFANNESVSYTIRLYVNYQQHD